MKNEKIKSTTIIGIRKDNLVVIAGDGQASLGSTIMKANVKKLEGWVQKTRLLLVLQAQLLMLSLCLKD